MAKTIITYGTFDMFHIGHLKLLERLSEMAEKVIVAVSTDEFNALKGKQTIIPYAQRAEIVAAIKHVDLVIAEESWEQKLTDIKEHEVDVFAIGEDWHGKFDYLKDDCEVVYLPRTKEISSSYLKETLEVFNQLTSQDFEKALSLMTQTNKEFK